jgi:nitric oxide dioxygenase
VEIHESLNEILQARDRLGLMFYEHFLAHYPQVQRYFEKVDLKRQSVLLTTALMIIQRHAERPTPAIEQYLQYLGSRHHDVNVPKDVYPLWVQAMLETLQQFHGDAWTPALARQWEDAFDRAIQLMFLGYESRVVV